MDFYGFYTGKEFTAHHFLGAHPVDNGIVFRTFAPAAYKVTVLGSFNNWQEIEMKKIYNGQFWEVIVPEAKHGDMYKYKIYNGDKSVIHADPYAFYSEKPGAESGNASIVYDMHRYWFGDDKWTRNRKGLKDGPVNVYEVHFGSWKKKEDGSCYSYTEMADMLIPYVKENGFNFIEIMPLNEYPSDSSWGYQATGFFSATSRYGEPDGLKEFIDKCHQNEIGVLLDFVPVHFALDEFALRNYDGTPLYEYPNTDVGNSEWGSCNFMHSRGEVCSFLQSSANFWLSEFHFDGLRMDAIVNLIYWQGNKARGENQNAIKFLQNMNGGLKELWPDVILVAEDSSPHKGVTKSEKDGGLGFDFKWDMGWMNDTLWYFQSAPESRSDNYHKLTFSMHYFYDEHFMLPLSHDEVCHGKGSVFQKMNASGDKMAQNRAMYLYMFMHPGKKLNFMGNEFAQNVEWDFNKGLEWKCAENKENQKFQRFFRDLNKVYLYHQALYEKEFEKASFEWIDCHQESEVVYAFKRISSKETICNFFNFSASEKNYDYKIPAGKKFKLLLNSDAEIYGGKCSENEKLVTESGDSIKIKLEPFSGVTFVEE